MLAHELRNPLAVMSSALQLWPLVLSDAERQQQLLEICRRQIKNLTRMVDDLLEMSRIDRGGVELQRAPLDLRDVVDNALHAVRDLLERRRLSVVTRIAPADFRTHGDATRLEQAVSNLLTNAAKYGEPGGNVELRLDALPDGGWARIEVRDEGQGIPADKLDAIFDIFVQVDVSLDRARGGLGIGLALVRAIVELHGGKAYADSEGIGQGSRFTVELPLLASPQQLPDAAPTPDVFPTWSPQQAGPAPRILLVEDNLDARDTLGALLAACGFTVTTAATGNEGLASIVNDRPDIAIVDIGLPGLDGFEVARRARAATGDATRLVAMTGYDAPAIHARAMQAGFDMHVAKPCTPQKLADILALPKRER